MYIFTLKVPFDTYMYMYQIKNHLTDIKTHFPVS